MSGKATQTVKVTEETWKQLHHRKNPGDTMDDVISRLIDDAGRIEMAAD